MSSRMISSSKAARVFGSIAALEYAMTIEFVNYLEARFLALSRPYWFEEIKSHRLASGEAFSYKNPRDLRFLLNEAGRADSWIADLIPQHDDSWVSNAKSLRRKLNQFHHCQIKPDFVNMNVFARLFELVGEPAGFEIVSTARAVQAEVKLLTKQSKEEVGPETTGVMPAIPIVGDDAHGSGLQERPPWGSRWVGPKPKRKLMLNRSTKDIYDEDGVSLKTSLHEHFETVIETWLRYYPMGGEVWVAEDGAAMGYIRGIPRMIGWLGEVPDPYKDSVRGFVLPHDYKLQAGDICDTTSGNVLQSVAAEDVTELLATLVVNVSEGEHLQVTEFGDVFVPVDEGLPSRIAWVHKDVWFPGHLPG